MIGDLIPPNVSSVFLWQTQKNKEGDVCVCVCVERGRERGGVGGGCVSQYAKMCD